MKRQSLFLKEYITYSRLKDEWVIISNIDLFIERCNDDIRHLTQICSSLKLQKIQCSNYRIMIKALIIEMRRQNDAIKGFKHFNNCRG